MSKIPLKIRTLTEAELSRFTSQDLILRNSKRMHGQLLVMAAIVIVALIIGTWDKLRELDVLWNSVPIVSKILLVLFIISCAVVTYSYFDKSVKLHVSQKRIETKGDVIKWEEVHEAFVNHQENHKGRIEFMLETGAKRKLDISGLELKPDEIAEELSNYWSANRQLRDAL